VEPWQIYLPFSCWVESDPDFSDSDQKNADSVLQARQSVIVDCVDGLVSSDYCLDFLESTGLNPDAYVQGVADQLDWLGEF